MKYIPPHILDKIARREERKIKELRQKLELPILRPANPSYKKEEDASVVPEPLIIEMS